MKVGGGWIVITAHVGWGVQCLTCDEGRCIKHSPLAARQKLCNFPARTLAALANSSPLLLLPDIAYTYSPSQFPRDAYNNFLSQRMATCTICTWSWSYLRGCMGPPTVNLLALWSLCIPGEVGEGGNSQLLTSAVQGGMSLITEMTKRVGEGGLLVGFRFQLPV